MYNKIQTIKKMRKITLLVLTLFFGVGALYPRQIKLLAIGNSFSEDALEHYLYGLVAANGDTILIGNLYIGGCSLEKHYNNSQGDLPAYSYRKIVNGIKTVTPHYRLSDALTDEEWDYISLQQVSSLSGQYESFFPYIELLMSYVKEHLLKTDVEFILHATWAYAKDSSHRGFAGYDNDQMKMYRDLIDATSRVAQRAGIGIIIPAGTAIQNGRTSSLGDSFCSDGYHLEHTYGRYTASCAWYEKLFGKSVVGNSYIPANTSPSHALIAQLAAHYAVREPYEITTICLPDSSSPISGDDSSSGSSAFLHDLPDCLHPAVVVVE